MEIKAVKRLIRFGTSCLFVFSTISARASENKICPEGKWEKPLVFNVAFNDYATGTDLYGPENSDIHTMRKLAKMVDSDQVTEVLSAQARHMKKEDFLKIGRAHV